MIRPSRQDFVLARANTRIAIIGTFLLAVYGCAQQPEGGPWLVPLALLLLARQAHLSRLRVAGYMRWRGAWDAMEGAASAPARPRARAAMPRLSARAPLIVLWTLLAAWFCLRGTDTSQPGYAAMAAVLAALTAGGAFRIIARVARRAGPPRVRVARSRADAFCVTQCRRAPLRSPSLAAIRAALPERCRALLRRSYNASPSSRFAPPRTR